MNVRLGCCLLIGFLSAGCVERKLIIQSEPAGADVILDSLRIGKTPVEVPFVFYGTRRLELKKPGYRTKVDFCPIRPPWYEWFPFELFSEGLIPWTIRDDREITLAMEKEFAAPEGTPERAAEETRKSDEMLRRGEEERERIKAEKAEREKR